jgi:hypothetical protein
MLNNISVPIHFVAQMASRECIDHSKNYVNMRRSFSTVTLKTEALSVVSSDIENQESSGSQDAIENEESCFQMCPICLDEFAAGDNVSWSKNQTCHHAFHKSCIEGWLKQLGREGCCPCCRGPYLNKLETDRGDEVRDLESQMDPESQLNSHVISILPDENITQFNECTEKSVEEVTRSSELEESSESISKPNKNEFSSFCIVHGLMR